MLKESSELREVFSLFHDLIEAQDPHGSMRPSPSQTIPGLLGDLAPDDSAQAPFPTRPTSTGTMSAAGFPAEDQPFPTAAPEPVEGEYRGERLENILSGMCQRGGFEGAVLSDAAGLPIAAYHSPAEVERVAAFTSILAEALGQAERFLGQQGSGHLSMDVGYADKLVIHRIHTEAMDLFLTILCRQEIDERGEIELSAGRLISEAGFGERA